MQFFLLYCRITQYKILNKKLSNSQLKKLKSGIKNNTEITSKISSNVVGGSNDDIKFRAFVKSLEIISQLIKNYQKCNCIKHDNQEDF